MKAKRLQGTAICPCGSGKVYRRCCWNKGFEWVVDRKGKIGRRVPMHPEVERVLREEEQWFEATFGRKPKKGDRMRFQQMRSSYMERGILEIMTKAGMPEEFLYAYQRSGVLVTEENKHLMPDNDLCEWSEAIDEFKRLSRNKPTIDDNTLEAQRILAQLQSALSDGITIIGSIIQQHGVARNFVGRKKHYVHHDYVLLCYTKALKTLQAVRALIKESYGEDSLTLARTIFEIYITVSFLIKEPNRINPLVVAPIRLECGLCEKVTVITNGKPRRMLKDKETGQLYPTRISIKERADGSYEPLDADIYVILYDYLSDFVHTNIEVMENYLDGHYFDDRNALKVYHGYLYAAFPMVLLFESLLTFRKLTRQHRRDMAFFTAKTSAVLRSAFSRMTEGESAAISELYIRRLAAVEERCRSWPEM